MPAALTTVFNNIAAKAETITQQGDEYIGQNGLLHCKECDKPRQVKIFVFDVERVVRCVCACKVAEQQAAERQKQQEATERRRRVCFQGTNMAAWCFANDDKQRPELSQAMQNYADQFKNYLDSGSGLLLYGSKGTGKTYMAACIANKVIDNGYTAYMTNFAQAANNLQATFEKTEYINSLCNYDLLVIDDLGTERKSEFMQEQVFNIIDARYRSGRPFIITSNLTAEELGQPGKIESGRIYDRILERCLPVKVDGQSRRRQKAATAWQEMRANLGMEVMQ